MSILGDRGWAHLVHAAKLGLSVESVKHKGRKAAPGGSRHSSGGSRHSLDGSGATGEGARHSPRRLASPAGSGPPSAGPRSGLSASGSRLAPSQSRPSASGLGPASSQSRPSASGSGPAPSQSRPAGGRRSPAGSQPGGFPQGGLFFENPLNLKTETGFTEGNEENKGRRICAILAQLEKIPHAGFHPLAASFTSFPSVNEFRSSG